MVKKIWAIALALSVVGLLTMAPSADARKGREDPRPPRCDGPRDRC
jgi:hypothetical protein